MLRCRAPSAHKLWPRVYRSVRTGCAWLWQWLLLQHVLAERHILAKWPQLQPTLLHVLDGHRTTTFNSSLRPRHSARLPSTRGATCLIRVPSTVLFGATERRAQGRSLLATTLEIQPSTRLNTSGGATPTRLSASPTTAAMCVRAYGIHPLPLSVQYPLSIHSRQVHCIHPPYHHRQVRVLRSLFHPPHPPRRVRSLQPSSHMPTTASLGVGRSVAYVPWVWKQLLTLLICAPTLVCTGRAPCAITSDVCAMLDCSSVDAIEVVCPSS